MNNAIIPLIVPLIEKTTGGKVVNTMTNKTIPFSCSSSRPDLYIECDIKIEVEVNGEQVSQMRRIVVMMEYNENGLGQSSMRNLVIRQGTMNKFMVDHPDSNVSNLQVLVINLNPNNKSSAMLKKNIKGIWFHNKSHFQNHLDVIKEKLPIWFEKFKDHTYVEAGISHGIEMVPNAVEAKVVLWEHRNGVEGYELAILKEFMFHDEEDVDDIADDCWLTRADIPSGLGRYNYDQDDKKEEDCPYFSHQSPVPRLDQSEDFMKINFIHPTIPKCWSIQLSGKTTVTSWKFKSWEIYNWNHIEHQSEENAKKYLEKKIKEKMKSKGYIQGVWDEDNDEDEED